MKLNRSHKKETLRTYQEDRRDGPRLVEEGSRWKDAAFQYAAGTLANQTELHRDQNRPHCRILSLHTHTHTNLCKSAYIYKQSTGSNTCTLQAHLHKPSSNHLLNNPVSTQITTLTGFEKQRSFLTNNVKRPPVDCDEWIKPRMLRTLSEWGMNEYIIMQGTTSLFRPHSLSVFLPINPLAWLPAHIQRCFCPD